MMIKIAPKYPGVAFKRFLNKVVRDKIFIGAPYLWLIVFFLVPFLIIVGISLTESIFGLPPYKNILDWEGVLLRVHLCFESYKTLLTEKLYQYALIRSLKFSLITTIFCLFLGYPMAYRIAQSTRNLQTILLFLVLLPFWTSALLRIYAWISLLSYEGLLNTLLVWIGISQQQIIGTDFAVCLGMIYCYLPFMILPLYASLNKFDWSLLEVASDLGCYPIKSFLTITLPLTKKGIISGCLLVLTPCMGEFVIPELLGGADTYVLGKVIWSEFFNNRDWPMACAVAVLMVMFLVIPIMVVQKFQGYLEK